MRGVYVWLWIFTGIRNAGHAAKRKNGTKKFFNTSGQKYRELGLKDKLQSMSEDEQLELLASDGMLIKRPITTDGSKVTVGFKEDQFKTYWL